MISALLTIAAATGIVCGIAVMIAVTYGFVKLTKSVFEE